MINYYLGYIGYSLLKKLTNYAKYTGLINYVSNNYDFYINYVDDNLAVSNLPKESHKHEIEKFDVVIGFLSKDEYGDHLTQWIDKLPNVKYYHIPVTDYTPPQQGDYNIFLRILDENKNKKILVHCYAGKGRSNCGAVAYLMSKGYSYEEGLDRVRQRIPRSGMNRWQLDSLVKLSKNIRGSMDDT